MAKQKKKKATVKKAAVKAAFSPRVNSIGVKLLGDRVLIKPAEVEMKTASGIIIPETAKKEKLMTGVVVAVGPGRFGDEADRIPMTVQVGDTVYFSRGWDEEGTKFTWRGEEYILITEADIKAILS